MELMGNGGGRVNQEYPMGKRKTMAMEQDMDAGMDELLAELGYKVRSSSMADLAQKLELLDRAMGNSSALDDIFLSHLASDSVHYNPSDMSRWVDNMLSELDAPPSATFPSPSVVDLSPINVSSWLGYPAQPSLSIQSDCGSDSHLGLESREWKRIRTASSSADCSGGLIRPSEVVYSSAMPMMMVESDHEAGIRLVHALVACAEAIQEENYKSADAIMKQITFLTSSQHGAMRKVGVYFAEALGRRIYSLHPKQDHYLDSAFSDILQMHFYETCPYLKFAHFTANQAILEAFAGHRRVHVIDFGIKQGMQWPALMQALALRPGGPPSFRLTGIASPQSDNSDSLQKLGLKLAQLARTINVEFEFRGLVANSLADLEPYMLDVEPEVIAINSVFELHGLLALPGAIEKVLDTVRSLRPRIVTTVEQEANHNADGFLERFTEALHYYSTLFDSMDGGSDEGSPEKLMSEVFVGRQICNVVACEGFERTERHETLEQWMLRIRGAGFESVNLGSNAFKQASMLLALFGRGDEYRIEEKEGCLTLGWNNRPLIATSAWRVAGAGDGVEAAR
ncbi:DELLA protein SLR1 [Dendrobium catenatum]|uniref:DELLA protein n=1 Tax=Dendrobium catenatum TaxID=906689 RepID=A0A2I0W1E0_9ASPA|nr:DELLA protein SLR1 [Dendrobium catenatum]PKU69448.1 DELLA protein GAI1 [Dendrobium catenatum]